MTQPIQSDLPSGGSLDEYALNDALQNLITNVREDISPEQMGKHLQIALEEAEDLLEQIGDRRF